MKDGVAATLSTTWAVKRNARTSTLSVCPLAFLLSGQMCKSFALALPRIILHSGRVVVRLGGTAVIDATVTGDSLRVIDWTKNGIRLDRSTRHQQLPNNSLLIQDIELSDAGLYRLTAVNDAGRTTRTVQLIVHGLQYSLSA